MDKSVPAWLATAIFYEIYPQSFNDSNGDGIGDLEGIRLKLDYIQSLGCNVIWLNPCFASPFGDAGYDVSDYCKIAPRYGTNADMKRLIRDCHRRGMRICLDFVPGHTSVEHPWFKASCSPKPNPYSDRYIWTPSVWNGATGFNSINAFSDRDGQFVTNFFWFQPALNYGFAKPDPKKPWQLPTNHPSVLATKRDMRNVMEFWLSMGVDGFRVDMASGLIKGDGYKAAMRQYWQEIRTWLLKRFPDTALIAEWSYPTDSIAAGFHMDFMIHVGTPAYNSLFRAEPRRTCFPWHEPTPSFFDPAGKGDLSIFLKHYLNFYKKTRQKGYISLPTGNHDITRLSIERTDADLKVALAFLFTMPGVPTLYYGDEIGLKYLHGLVSKEGGFGRTGARTPMQWNGGQNAGFSTAAAKKLYLPVDPAANRPTVAAQEKDPNSILNHVRTLLALRKAHPALGNDSALEVLHGKKGSTAFVYLRRAGKQSLLVAINPAAKAATATFRSKHVKGAGAMLFGKKCKLVKQANGTFTLTIPARGYAVMDISATAP